MVVEGVGHTIVTARQNSQSNDTSTAVEHRLGTTVGGSGYTRYLTVVVDGVSKGGAQIGDVVATEEASLRSTAV
jgi:hypothetical protein